MLTCKRYKNKALFLKAWEKLEDQAYLRNFKNEPFNWACFCRFEKNGKHFSASPKADFLTIEIYELSEKDG